MAIKRKTTKNTPDNNGSSCILPPTNYLIHHTKLCNFCTFQLNSKLRETSSS